MWRVYIIHYSLPFSYSSYKHIVYKDFNLRFTPPKKDIYKTCDFLKVSIRNATDEETRNELQDQHKKHHDIDQDAKDRMDNDLLRAVIYAKLQTLTFNLQKVLLVMPKNPTNIVFYTRQLSIYNFGIHRLKNRDYIYVWGEHEGDVVTKR